MKWFSREVGLKICAISDGSNAVLDGSAKGQAARIIGLMPAGEGTAFAPVDHRSGRARRVTHGSYGIELVSSVEATEAAQGVGLIAEEFIAGPPVLLRSAVMMKLLGERGDRPRVPIVLDTDAFGAVQKVTNERVDPSLSASRRQDVALLKEALVGQEGSDMRHIWGPTNPVDPLSKSSDSAGVRESRAELEKLWESGTYSADLSRAEERHALLQAQAVLQAQKERRRPKRRVTSG